MAPARSEAGGRSTVVQCTRQAGVRQATTGPSPDSSGTDGRIQVRSVVHPSARTYPATWPAAISRSACATLTSRGSDHHAIPAHATQAAIRRTRTTAKTRSRAVRSGR